MDQNADSCLLRIFVGESDRMEAGPLYEWLVRQARQRGMAGATVLRGIMGFGAHTRMIHTFKIERLSEDLPIVIEMVDSREKIEAFLEFAERRSTGVFWQPQNASRCVCTEAENRRPDSPLVGGRLAWLHRRSRC